MLIVCSATITLSRLGFQFFSPDVLITITQGLLFRPEHRMP